jgi:hypothetical protein
MESVYKLSKYSQKINEACRAKQFDRVIEYNKHELAYINKLSKYFGNQKGGATFQEVMDVFVRVIKQAVQLNQVKLDNVTRELEAAKAAEADALKKGENAKSATRTGVQALQQALQQAKDATTAKDKAEVAQERAEATTRSLQQAKNEAEAAAAAATAAKDKAEAVTLTLQQTKDAEIQALHKAATRAATAAKDEARVAIQALQQALQQAKDEAEAATAAKDEAQAATRAATAAKDEAQAATQAATAAKDEAQAQLLSVQQEFAEVKQALEQSVRNLEQQVAARGGSKRR